jgi:dipeptidase
MLYALWLLVTTPLWPDSRAGVNEAGVTVSLCSVITSYNIVSHNSPDEIFCSMAPYMQNHFSLKKIKDLARGYF